MKKIFLKCASAALAVSMVLGGGLSVDARQMWMQVNNQGVQREVCQVWGFDMLPVLDIAGEMGFGVSFDGTVAILSKDTVSYTFTIGDASVYDSYGNWYGLDVVPQYINGYFMIPAKFLTDVFGYSYVWDATMDYLFLNSEEKYNIMLNSETYKMAAKYHTPDFKEKARKALGIPDGLAVDGIYGEPWHWEGAGMYLTPITFYHNGEAVAFADFSTETHEIMRGIYMYSGK